MTKFGVQPSEIAKMSIIAAVKLMESDGKEVVTLADTAALHRFFMNQ